MHVEHGSAAWSLTQVLLLRRLLGLETRVILFTWWNLDTRLRFLLDLTERFNLSRVDSAIAGNQDARRILRAKGLSAPIAVSPLWGIDPQRWERAEPEQVAEARRALSIGARHFVVGYAGRFVLQKGLLTLLEAVARLGVEVHALLVGAGPLEGELVRRAADLGLSDRLHIVSTVPHSELPSYLSAMDALVLPSETTPSWKEQFGHVLIEAMACETPVVGSDSGEIPHVIGKAGLVFREGDASDLARGLQMLVDHPSLRSGLALKGRRRVLAEYTHQRIAEDTYQVYRELVSGE